jgi:hypothetical protein
MSRHVEKRYSTSSSGLAVVVLQNEDASKEKVKSSEVTSAVSALYLVDVVPALPPLLIGRFQLNSKLEVIIKDNAPTREKA